MSERATRQALGVDHWIDRADIAELLIEDFEAGAQDLIDAVRSDDRAAVDAAIGTLTKLDNVADPRG